MVYLVGATGISILFAIATYLISEDDIFMAFMFSISAILVFIRTITIQIG